MNEGGASSEIPFGRVRRRARRLRSLPLRSLVPNILTVLALCAGLTSVRLGLEGRFELAVIAILVAAVLDGMDGRLARLLRGATRFGAELDSLTDFVNFGVAPILLLYNWTLSQLGGFGWIVALAYSVCCALRLARFNTALDDPDRPAWARSFFVGMPAPAGAVTAMLPLYLAFLGFEQLRVWPLFIALYVCGIAFLMISRIPTFSGKGTRVRRDHVLTLLVLVALLTALLVSYPWLTLAGAATAYFASLPLSRMRFRRYEREGSYPGSGEGDPDEDDAGEDDIELDYAPSHPAEARPRAVR